MASELDFVFVLFSSLFFSLLIGHFDFYAIQGGSESWVHGQGGIIVWQQIPGPLINRTLAAPVSPVPVLLPHHHLVRVCSVAMAARGKWYDCVEVDAEG
jgi:hypothetical protein